ncbi:hypothetical protein NKI80_07190 [Mesorhizobium sp. M0387]|uniref:hypothetical protein n=1 Tax=Mesorhizobium sp. M0387 TaxID=2956940 RepID=UPI00333618DE
MSESSDTKPVRRQRKKFDPPPKRRYVSGPAALFFLQPTDSATPPAFGHRVRDKYRGPSLRPAPLKA